jgi:2-polyprenyl-3-methyl-5-hydroxy-6-metoxy-1,4-benzoquinol methylase
MSKKTNSIDNWNNDYKNLKITYTDKYQSPSDFVNIIQYQFVLDDIRKYLPNNLSPSILECGCGGARTSLYLATNGLDITCSDNSPEALRLAKANFDSVCQSARFINDDLLDTKLPLESFDCVISFGLLEHFENIDHLIGNMTALVKPGGIQIHCIIPKKFSSVSIFNAIYFPARLIRNIFKGRFQKIIEKSFRDFPHYENSYTYQQYVAAFEKFGNKLIKCEASGVLYPLLNLPFGVGRLMIKTFPSLLESIVKRADRSSNVFMHFFAPTFYIVCKKEYHS